MRALVCGEDCSIQTCPSCAVQQAKETVVDVILSRTLEDIDLEQEGLDDILITLPNCRHTFTVETLDGICDMDEFYRRNETHSGWFGFRDPPVGFRKPPTCPTCRAAITSPRYGRIYKRADLDILENNVASRMSHALQTVHRLNESVDKSEIKTILSRAAATIKLEDGHIAKGALKKQKKVRQALLRGKRELPVPPDALKPVNHGVASIAAATWEKATRQLLAVYIQARKVAETRSAHVNAWESAFSCLYHAEIDSSLQDPARAPRNPTEHAMRIARMKVGQPPPRADKRFVVEAFWISLSSRFSLVSLGQTWLDDLNKRGSVTFPRVQHHLWATYIEFVLETCSQDAQIAFEIAQKSESHRQVAKTMLFQMRASLELFRFNVAMCRQNGALTLDDRTELVLAAAEQADNAKKIIQSTVGTYLKVRGSGASEQQWIKTNFTATAETIFEEWGAMKNSLRAGTFYTPVSLEEKMSIVRAFGFCEFDRVQ